MLPFVSSLSISAECELSDTVRTWSVHSRYGISSNSGRIFCRRLAVCGFRFVSHTTILPPHLEAATFTRVGRHYIYRMTLLANTHLRLETSAPLFSHFIESLSGLVTIRAFGWTGGYTNKTNKLLDQSQKPFYLLLCIQRWLVLVLDLVVAGLAVLLVGLAVALRSKINPGFLGIALVQLTSLSHALTSLVQFWTLLETSLGAISRIKDFSETTPSEATAEESGESPSNWPHHGALTFDSVSASYEDNGPLILKNVSFSLKGGQKIGIIGRTGR